MAGSGMTFTLRGRDELSDALRSAGRSAVDLQRRLDDASAKGTEAMDKLKASLISLAPAAIPAAASMAPLAASTAAAGAALVAYGAALGPQIAAMGEATTAQDRYEQAVEESGAQSQEARQAQAAYARELAKLPPATRQAAAHLGVLKDTYKEWSDSLAGDTMAPFTKGLATANALLPKTAPLVRGTSAELDRFTTLVAGSMASPGFDRLSARFTDFATGTLTRTNDALVSFLRTTDTKQVGAGLTEFMDYARAAGPIVGDTLRNAGQALVNIARAAADVGVGMLQAVNAVSKLVAAVPPAAITTFLQLAIAVKAVNLAMVGLAAGRAAMLAFTGQLAAMRIAAASAPGPLAAAGAAISTLSRTAKLAAAGTGIGLLVIALTELSRIGRGAPPDVDAMTASLGKFARGGALSGEAARVLGADLGELEKSLRTMARPSNRESFQQWMTQLANMDSTPVKVAKEQLDALDKGLVALVQGGKPELAAAALQRVAKGMGNLTEAELREELGDYQAALDNVKLEAELTAEAMGLFGREAQAVQGKLNEQKQAAEGLRLSVIALNNVYLQSRGDVRAMEAAIDAASQSLKDNGRTLDDNTEAGRRNNAALDAIASTTLQAMDAKYQETGSWNEALKVYERGRTALDKSTQGMARSKGEAAALAAQILRTPNKTAMLRADKRDLEQKLKDAKAELARVPDSKKAQVRANIEQFNKQLAAVKSKLRQLDGDTATTYVVTKYVVQGDSARKGKGQGSQLKYATGGLVYGPGTSTSDSVPLWASAGEYIIKASSVDRYGLDMMRAINEGRLAKSGVTDVSRPALSAPAARPGMGRPAAAGGRRVVVQNTFNITGAVDPTAVAKQIQQVLLHLKRLGGGNIDLGLS
ncbi:hypothetical protein [Streptomyces zhihengii]